MNNVKPFIKLKPIVIGALCGIFFISIALSLSSILFVLSGSLVQTALMPISFITLILSTFISGYISSKVSKSNGIVYGLISGLFIFGVIFFGGLITTNSSITIISVFKAFLAIFCGGFGGVIGVNR